MSELMALLTRAAAGDREAYDAAYAIAYPALKQLARRQKGAQPGAHVANTTSVVNDACLRLLRGVNAECETHFYAIAARAMRQILIDQARARLAVKRGAGFAPATDSDAIEDIHIPGMSQVDVLALDQALEQLHALDADLSRVVELHCFAGLDMESIGRISGVSERTTRRNWRRARAFLVLRLDEALA
jgi:RNA polymerase sigma factor (TIGR02999 family)